MPENQQPLHVAKPKWLKTKIPTGETFFEIKKDLRGRKLFTVCEEAKCPNIGECWNTRTATFMVLGDTCTRACRFCNVKTGNPQGWLDSSEPEQVAESCKSMGLEYVVITMVDRDDLPDGGAAHLIKVVKSVKELNPRIKIELLTGDFHGDPELIKSIVASGIHVFAHNLETVKRLTPRVRDARAGYEQSLEVMKIAYRAAQKYGVMTKSALMLGLGETQEERLACMDDMREANVQLLTVGQYMRPTKKHLSIKEWVHPDEFAEIEKQAYSKGFLAAVASPLVRSSYKAKDFYFQAQQKLSVLSDL